MNHAHNDLTMIASEHKEIRRSLRGNLTRVGGVLAGIALACGVQPFAADAHTNASAHFDLYSEYLHEAGVTWGMDLNVQPGDQALVDKAHTEEATGSQWQHAMLAEEGGALLLIGTGIAAGMIAARHAETAAAVWLAVTKAVPSGE
ncbi:MAG TPA: hypothetical protein VGO07_00195 [Candidatus Saccharimonadales bacterium]|jgi:hypothetical protein|nr:hypothetical protein [Candidatus Saccharimonadales bacterium]